MMSLPRSPMAARVGLILCRVVVPLWVLAGAGFKLLEHTPKTLPEKTILALAGSLGIHLYFLLALLIAIEFVAVAVMVFVGRLARPVAIVMLSIFCMVLIGEMVQGNITSCGCLGGTSPPPWAMLAIDATLLVGVILLRPAPLLAAAAWTLPAASVAGLAGVAASFAVVIPAGRPSPQAQPDTPGTAAAFTYTAGAANPNPLPLPGFWYIADASALVGQKWHDVEIIRFLPKFPSGLDGPKRYVVFYSRTCEHCEAMFNDDLADPTLGAQVTAVQIPSDKHTLTAPEAWYMPQTAVEHLALPVGCDWVITPPLALRIENGIVTCATEGDHRTCLELP